MIDDESLVKTRTNICLSDASAVSSYSVSWRMKTIADATIPVHQFMAKFEM